MSCATAVNGPSPRTKSLCGICARGLNKVRGGTEIEATFLFADIRGSTAIAERTSPAAFHDLLERFYTATGRAIDEGEKRSGRGL